MTWAVLQKMYIRFWRVWTKIQPKPFLVHTSSLKSFTLELSTVQIFWAENTAGMLWTLVKLGQKPWFSLFLGYFELFLSKIEVKWPKNSEKTCFWPKFAKPYNIPARFCVKNIQRVDSSWVKLSKLEVWTRKGFD